MKRFAQMKLWFDLVRFERRFSAVHFSKFYLLFSYCKNSAKQLLCLALVEGGNLRTSSAAVNRHSPVTHRAIESEA
jgi:hypothetical protein